MRTDPFQVDQATGHFAFQACRFDRRFSYCAYVPPHYTLTNADRFRLLVAVHGSERAPEAARELFVELAKETDCAVLAPLFPMAATEDDEIHNYLFLKYRDIRFDLILLAMVEEMRERFGVPIEKFWLAGFSGGGQFAHRFMYLHASRLAAVSVGAPGMVNSLDPSRDWFVGVRDVEEKFGQDIDRHGLHGLPVQVVVGGADIGHDIMVKPSNPLYMEGVNEAGATRVERSRFLHRALMQAGVLSQLDIVPGASHKAQDVQLAVDEFFRKLHESQSGAAAETLTGQMTYGPA